MRKLVWALLLASCAHSGKKVIFNDDSEDDKTGWVCVPDKDHGNDMACITLEHFSQLLNKRRDM